MLYIYLKRPDRVIETIDGWFRRHKSKDWFNDPLVKDIILGIDKSVAVKDEYIESPVLGTIVPDRLSTGCKAVIIMWVQDEQPVWATSCGDNCAKYIVEVSRRKDVYIWLAHIMHFNMDFEAIFMESNRHIYTNDEYLEEIVRLRQLKD